MTRALDTSLVTKADIVRVEADLSVIKCMIGALIAIAAANFAMQFFDSAWRQTTLDRSMKGKP